MDNPRFDALTRRLASLVSRRCFGQALLLTGAGLGAGGAEESSGKKKRKKKRKKRPAPSCPNGTTLCGGACVSTGSNPAHCGGCNRPCGGEQVCVTGGCEDRCLTDFDCYSVQNPNGFECTSIPGSATTICGCRPDPVVPRRACNGGEPCSTCCSNEECILRTGNGLMICANFPPQAVILGRSCCLPTGAPCGIGCCGVCGAGNKCAGLPLGANCGINQACASGVCGVDFKCT